MQGARNSGPVRPADRKSSSAAAGSFSAPAGAAGAARARQAATAPPKKAPPAKKVLMIQSIAIAIHKTDLGTACASFLYLLAVYTLD